MEFLDPQRRNLYLKRLSASFLHSYSGADLRQASSLPTICISTEDAAEKEHVLQLHRQQIEAELEIVTTETLASLKRRSKYQAVTIPSSVKHQVTETPSSMARPRSPQRKNEVDHVYLQGLLDERLAVIRQQLNSLSNERAKMEQKMEDLVNGIKEVREQSAHMPKRIIITGSTPGSIRRVHSMDCRKKHAARTDSEQSLLKYKSGAYYHTQLSTSPPLEEVDGESWPYHQRFASVSSISSSGGVYRDSDVASLNDSMNSSLYSGSTAHSLHPPSVMGYMDERPGPTPIPELPESPSVSRPITPHVHVHSPIHRPRSSSSTTPPSALRISSSPRHQRMHSQPSPTHPHTPSHPLLSPSGMSTGSITPTMTRARSGSFSMLASPRLALKSTLSSSDLRARSTSSPAPLKKKSPSSKLRHNKKDQRLSYFRKNSFTDLESSLKGSQTSILDDDDGCELKGSRDNVADFSRGGFGEQDSPTGTTGRPNARILRRSSLTGQIEHVASLRAQVRRNNSFNASSVTSVEGSKHPALKQQHSLCSRDPRYSLTPTPPRRIVYLKSKETTV